MFRFLIFSLGVVLGLPLLALIAFAFVTPITISGVAYLIGCSFAVAGLLIAPWRRKYSFVITAVGFAVIVAIVIVRLVLARDEGAAPNLRMIVLPGGQATRWVDYLVDEQDSVIFGETALHLLGGVSPREHENIVPALYSAYSEFRAAKGVFPSPVVTTYLNLQGPAAFDALVIEPGNGQPAKFGVVFLHGFMGNVTIQCWRIAQAAQKLGAVTVCPSTDWVGNWSQPQGAAIVRATLLYLRERGIQRIYLGGFSNGGIGTSLLAPNVATEGDLSGLFFIAGATNGVNIGKTNLPVLVIQGAQDERMPVTEARRFVAEITRRATYVELEGDHFLIMKQSAHVQEAIAAWLGNYESDK